TVWHGSDERARRCDQWIIHWSGRPHWGTLRWFAAPAVGVARASRVGRPVADPRRGGSYPDHHGGGAWRRFAARFPVSAGRAGKPGVDRNSADLRNGFRDSHHHGCAVHGEDIPP